MTPAEYQSTTVTVQADPFELRVRGRVLRFDGFTRVLPTASRKGDPVEVPAYATGERLDCAKIEPVQHFTKPPPRYSEASLVRELEKRGIGRPSTYASIISTIQDRGYASLKKRRFYAEKIGELVTDRLVESFADLLDYSFTAVMEQDLDQIASGDRQWNGVLDAFYRDFSDKLKAAAQPDGMRPNTPTVTGISCTACGRPMQIRSASTGVFLGCSGYALPPKERCKQTIDLTPADEAADAEGGDDEGESRLLRAKRRCPTCGTAMDSYVVDARRKLHVCGKNPYCAGHEIEEGTFSAAAAPERTIACDRCGSEMPLRSGRFGKFFGCSNPECRNTRKLLRNGEPAPPKSDPVPMPELRCERVDDHYVLRDGAAGLFLAASGFPRHRETRAPKVSELQPHADELDPKFRYLLDAPAADPEGRPAVIRFSRKGGRAVRDVGGGRQGHAVARRLPGRPLGRTGAGGETVRQGQPQAEAPAAARGKSPSGLRPGTVPTFGRAGWAAIGGRSATSRSRSATISGLAPVARPRPGPGAGSRGRRVGVACDPHHRRGARGQRGGVAGGAAGRAGHAVRDAAGAADPGPPHGPARRARLQQLVSGRPDRERGGAAQGRDAAARVAGDAGGRRDPGSRRRRPRGGPGAVRAGHHRGARRGAAGDDPAGGGSRPVALRRPA